MLKATEQLKKSILFNHLSKEDIEKLLLDITYTVKQFKKNEIIFSPHLPCDTLGIILEGTVEVQKILASGKAVTVTRRTQAELIADASLFAETDYYPSTISACEECYIFLINKSNLLKLFSKDEKIIAKFLESVSNRVLALNNTIEILSLNSVAAKIAYFLLSEYKKQNNNTIILKFTKKTLAEHLNVSRPTLSRELKSLQLMGILSFSKRTIKIHNIAKLEELCSC